MTIRKTRTQSSQKAAGSSNGSDTSSSRRETGSPSLTSKAGMARTVQSSAAALRSYGWLLNKAQTSSMWWWALKVVQGGLFSGLLLALGLLLRVLNLFGDQNSVWSGLASGLMLLGGIVFVRYMLAPVTAWFGDLYSPQRNGLVQLFLNLALCRWAVLVPQNWYYMVLDSNDFTERFLRQGWNVIPWRWKVNICEYLQCNFLRVTSKELKNVLSSNLYPITVQVTATFNFDPTTVDRQDMLGALRQMATEANIAASISDYIDAAVVIYVNEPQRAATAGVAGYDNTPSLRQYLEKCLSIFGKPLGLTLAGSEAVAVNITMPTSMWLFDRLDRAQTEQELRQLAADNHLSMEDATRLWRMIRPRSYRPHHTGRRSQPSVIVIDAKASAVSEGEARPAAGSRPASIPAGLPAGAAASAAEALTAAALQPATESESVAELAEAPIVEAKAQPSPMQPEETIDEVAQFLRSQGYTIDPYVERRKRRTSSYR